MVKRSNLICVVGTTENVSIEGVAFGVQVSVRNYESGPYAVQLKIVTQVKGRKPKRTFQGGALRTDVESWLEEKGLPKALYLPAARLARAVDERAAFSDTAFGGGRIWY